jgi:hypothetical protein
MASRMHVFLLMAHMPVCLFMGEAYFCPSDTNLNTMFIVNATSDKPIDLSD